MKKIDKTSMAVLAAHIEEYKRLGATNMAQFCEQRGLKKHRFKYWLYKNKKADIVASNFVTVSAKPQMEQKNLPYLEIIYPNAVKIRLTGQPETSLLSQLVRLF